MEKLSRKFTEEEVSELMCGGVIYDDQDNEIFEQVSKEIIGNDSEKSYVTYEVVIRDIANDKYYMAELGESPWYKQAEHNAAAVWHRVYPKKMTVTKYI